MADIDPKVRAIYHLMLNDKIFIEDPSQGNKRYVWTCDEEVAQEIIDCSTPEMSALQIARVLSYRLKGIKI